MKKHGAVVFWLVVLLVAAVAIYLFLHRITTARIVRGGMARAKKEITLLCLDARSVARRDVICTGVRFQQSRTGTQYVLLIVEGQDMPAVVSPDNPKKSYQPFVQMLNHSPLDLGSKIIIASPDPNCENGIDVNTPVTITFSRQGIPATMDLIMRPHPQLSIDEFYGDGGLFGDETAGCCSCTSFYIYDRSELEESNSPQDFFANLKPVFISANGAPAFD